MSDVCPPTRPWTPGCLLVLAALTGAASCSDDDASTSLAAGATGSGGSGGGLEGGGGGTAGAGGESPSSPATLRLRNLNGTPAAATRVLSYDEAGEVNAVAQTDDLGEVEIDPSNASFVVAFNLMEVELANGTIDIAREALVLTILPEPGGSATVGFRQTSGAAQPPSTPPEPPMSLTLSATGLPPDTTHLEVRAACGMTTAAVTPPNATIIANVPLGCSDATTFHVLAIAKRPSPTGLDPFAYHFAGPFALVSGATAAASAPTWTAMSPLNLSVADAPPPFESAEVSVELEALGTRYWMARSGDLWGDGFQGMLPMPDLDGPLFVTWRVHGFDGYFEQDIFRFLLTDQPPRDKTWSAASIARFTAPDLTTSAPAVWILGGGKLGEAMITEVRWIVDTEEQGFWRPLTWTFLAPASASFAPAYPELPSELSEWSPQSLDLSVQHNAFHIDLDDSDDPFASFEVIAEGQLYDRSLTFVDAGTEAL